MDTGIGLAVIGLTAALGVIGAYLAPNAWHSTLYGLCIASAVLTAAQTVRAVRGALHHERRFAELDEGQRYLAQPEAYRQLDTLMTHHVAFQDAHRIFDDNFDIDSAVAAESQARCKTCTWATEVKALVHVREDAVQHYRVFHVPPERKSWFGFRRGRERTTT
jgi:hypothetical protein